MKKILAISFAIMLLIGNVGITMATHLCGGQAVTSRIMIGTGHIDCGMPATDADCGSEQDKPEPCCENEYLPVEVEEDYPKSTIQPNFNVDFAVAYVHIILTSRLLLEEDKPRYLHYFPPLLLRDVSVLNQVFII